MTSSPTSRPAWVIPSLLVAVFTVVYLVLRVVLGDDTGQSAFPTQQVPEPSTSALSSKATPQTDELGLTGDGIGPHRLGDDAPAVLEALTDVLGPPTEDPHRRNARLACRLGGSGGRISASACTPASSWPTSRASTTRPDRDRSPSPRQRDSRLVIR